MCMSSKIFAVYLHASLWFHKYKSSEYMLSNAAVNSLNDMVSICRTPLLMLILLLSLCRWTVMELMCFLQDFEL